MDEEQHTYISCIECAMLNEFQPCESYHNSQGQQLQFTPRYESEEYNTIKSNILDQ